MLVLVRAVMMQRMLSSISLHLAPYCVCVWDRVLSHVRLLYVAVTEVKREISKVYYGSSGSEGKQSNKNKSVTCKCQQ